MLAHLAVPYVDVSAAHLSWALASAGLPPLASVDVVVGAASVRLTVLGASHEVVVEVGRDECTEAVACGLTGGPVPASTRRVVSGLEYQFSSTVLQLAPDELAVRTRRLLSRLAPDPRALVAAFPGHPEAVTALAVRDEGTGVAWRTWHAYPRSGELLVTSTRVARR